MSKKTMTGEVRKAMEVTLGDKIRTNRTIYNDWKGRKTLPNARDFKCSYCVLKRLYERDIEALRHSLQQRMRHFGLKVLSVDVMQPWNSDRYPTLIPGIKYAGSIYIQTIEINS